MKGLMVSLIVVFFAGTTGNVMAATQQDAAGFEPRSGLQPIGMPEFERPGPDDSDEDNDWPTPASLVSRGSTNTSQSVGDQFASPAPESAGDRDIRFDVKVDKNAIELLRQGRKVFSPVQVRDESTDAPLDPSVVSDIALFLDANAGKKLTGVQLDPQPMEPGSNTLRFEIHEDQLDRIEQDAFLFNVPNNLRGQFDRVEFVAVSGPSGSHEFSSGLTSGPRGSAVGFGNPDADRRFGATPTQRFRNSNNNSNEDENQRWNTNSPQPGPGYEPGDPEFTGPYIDPVELQTRRNRVAPLEQNRNFNRQPEFPQRREQARSPLDTDNRFQVADRELEADSQRSPFGRTWEQPELKRNPVNQNQDTFRRNTTNQATAEQRYQESLADQRLRTLQQQLADAETEKKLLKRDASNWMKEAESLAQERSDLSKQLQTANDRRYTSQPYNTQQVSTRPVEYQPRYTTDRSYLDRTIDAAKGLVGRPFSTQREDFPTRETAFSNSTEAELELETENARLAQRTRDQAKEVGRLTALLQRRSTADDRIQQTAYSNSTDPAKNQFQPNARNPDGSERTQNFGTFDDQRNRPPGENAQPPFLPKNYDQNQQAYQSPNQRGVDRNKGQQPVTIKSRSSDLIWLLPLLLGSLALNFFLWVHSRSLYLRYSDLADELRGMVGASTI